jgi:hypothetical protein
MKRMAKLVSGRGLPNRETSSAKTSGSLGGTGHYVIVTLKAQAPQENVLGSA